MRRDASNDALRGAIKSMGLSRRASFSMYWTFWLLRRTACTKDQFEEFIAKAHFRTHEIQTTRLASRYGSKNDDASALDLRFYRRPPIGTVLASAASSSTNGEQIDKTRLRSPVQANTEKLVFLRQRLDEGNITS